MKDLVGGVIFLVFSAAMLVASGQIRNPGFDELGPAFLPRFVLVPMLVLSAVLTVQGVLKVRAEARVAKGKGVKAGAGSASLRTQALIFVELIAFVAALTSRLVPFEVIGVIFVAVSGVTLIGWRDRRLLGWLAAGAIVVPVVVGFVFKTYLFVNLP